MASPRLALIVCLLPLLPLLPACDGSDGAAPGSEQPPVPVLIAKAEPRTIPRTIPTVGAFDSPEMTTVASEIEGRVVALDVPEGRRVEQGHVLARLDDAEAKAALRVTRARLDNARDRLKRLERMREQSVSSEQAHDDARAEFDAATGARDEAQTRLEKTTIRAPFTGVLGLEQVNVGQYVDGGTPIVELTQVDPLEFVFAVPQRYAGDLALGQTVRGRIGRCGPRFEGTVDAIDPRVDETTRSVRLQASVPNSDGSLYPGMAASLELLVGEIADAIVVPQEAIVRQGTRHIVYSIADDDTAQQSTVELGQFFPAGVHVRSGIAPGARVVAAGQQKLRPGTPTEPSPFEQTRNPNLSLGSLDGCGDLR
ncbi:MAG: efflux RND transporter periplasmic adaptor subunit [Myxococcota bacterium]